MREMAKKKQSDIAFAGKQAAYHRPAVSAAIDMTSYYSDNLTLQRASACPCDGGCPRCAHAIQPKLKIGQPNDKYEQEADRVAEQVMRMPEPKVQRQIEEDEEEEILQTKPIADQITPLVQRQIEPEEEEEEETIQAKQAGGQIAHAGPGLQARINSLKGGGQPVPRSTRNFFEPRFGYDFSGVRVHKDAKAAESAYAVNARSFTVGENIVFGDGQYAPGTADGRNLLAHELVHVVQQRVVASASDRVQRDTPRTGHVHDRPAFEEQHVGFARYRFEEGWVYIEGPSGAGGHALTAPGFDGVAYNTHTGELELVEQKGISRTRPVELKDKPTAVTKKLVKNLDDVIAKVAKMTDLPDQRKILSLLKKTRDALDGKGTVPDRVRIRITSERGTRITKGLRDYWKKRGVDLTVEFGSTAVEKKAKSTTGAKTKKKKKKRKKRKTQKKVKTQKPKQKKGLMELRSKADELGEELGKVGQQEHRALQQLQGRRSAKARKEALKRANMKITRVRKTAKKFRDGTVRKFGRKVAEKVGLRAVRVAAKFIPFLNIASTTWDLVDVAGALSRYFLDSDKLPTMTMEGREKHEALFFGYRGGEEVLWTENLLGIYPGTFSCGTRWCVVRYCYSNDPSGGDRPWKQDPTSDRCVWYVTPRDNQHLIMKELHRTGQWERNPVPPIKAWILPNKELYRILLNRALDMRSREYEGDLIISDLKDIARLYGMTDYDKDLDEEQKSFLRTLAYRKH